MQKKQIIDKLNILKNRYPDEEEGVLLLACHLGSKVEQAKECKEKLEACIDYRDIAQKVIKPLYVNCEIDEEQAKKKGFLMALLPLTVYGKQGKYNSLLYHVSLMLAEKEVKEQRKKVVAQRNALLPAEKVSGGSDVVAYNLDDSPFRVVLEVPAGKARETISTLKGMEVGGLVQIASVTPCQSSRLMGRKVKYTILGKSVNVIQAIERLQVLADRNQRLSMMSGRLSVSRKLPLSKRLKAARHYRRGYAATASSDIVVSFPQGVAGIPPGVSGFPHGVDKRKWKFANVMPPGVSLSGMSDKKAQAGRVRKLVLVNKDSGVYRVIIENPQS